MIRLALCAHALQHGFFFLAAISLIDALEHEPPPGVYGLLHVMMFIIY